MKKVFIMILLGCIFFSVQGQNNTSKQKLTRKEKKELRLKQEEKTKIIIDSLINKRQFVLKINQLDGMMFELISVCSSINYIKVDSNVAISQFGSIGRTNVQGIGNSTTKGRITKFEVYNSEKSGWYQISMIISAQNSFQIRMNVSPLGIADAEVSTKNHMSLTCSGEIFELSDFAIF